MKKMNASAGAHARSNAALDTAASADLRARAVEGFMLHFFSNINLASDAMDAIEPHGLSKTHNRILGFAAMCPGLSVGELVRALRVSHQNLNAPMRQLIQQRLLVAQIGQEDRRQKNLFVTPKGRKLVEAVYERQMARMETAYLACGPEAVEGFLKVQRHLVEDQDREWVERMGRDPTGVSRG